MTVSSETMRSTGTGNGSNDTFPFTFLILDDDDLEVYVDGVLQTKTTHYTIPAAGIGEDAGGNVVFESTSIPADQAAVVMIRSMDLLQEIDYVEGDDFPANVHERGLDRLVMIAQMLSEKLDRAVQLDKWSTYSGLTLPDPEDGYYLAWKSDLSGLKNVVFQSTVLAVSSFVEDLLDDADAATFMGTLGISSFIQTLVDDADAEAARNTLLIPGALPGFLIRSNVVHTDDDTIKLGPATYHHQGTIEQLVYWDAQLTFECFRGGAGGSNADNDDAGTDDWHYIYLDDSAIVTAGTNVVTASELLNDTTEPAWSDAKQGWYNGEDRCIFAIYVDSSGDIEEFHHNGGEYVAFSDQQTDRGLSILTQAAGWWNVALTIPNFANLAQVTLEAEKGDADAYLYCRKDGSSGTTGHKAVILHTGADRGMNTLMVHASLSAEQIEIYMSAGTTNEAAVHTDGWFLPRGL